MTHRTESHLLVAVALVAGAFTGCLTAPQPTIELPAPTLGARYVYDGPEQARLTVTVNETDRRVDGHLEGHDVVILEWRYRRKAGDYTYTLWEAVDRATGHVVQQVRRCVPYDQYHRPDDPPRACFDERATVHLAGSAGLPGAFGAGPFWGRTLETGGVTVPLPVQGATLAPDRIAYDVAPAGEDRGCLELESSTNVTRVRPLPQTVTRGPVTLCPYAALPVAFTTFLGDRFERVDYQAGTDPLPPSDETDPWGSDDPAVPLRTWSDPVAVDSTDGDPYNFSFEEAHRWALENNSRYREILQEPPEGLALWTWAKPGGSGSIAGGLVSINYSRRQLLALQADGQGTLLTLRQEHRSPRTPGSGEPISRVEQENFTRGEPIPTRDSLAAASADMADTLELAKTIIGNSVEGSVGISQVTSLRYPPGSPRGASGPWRGDGTVNVVWTEEDPPYPLAEMGLAVRTPYPFVVDGPTGAVEFLSLNRTRLPVGQHVPR